MKIVGDFEIIGIRDPNTENERVLLRAINTTTLEWYLLINTKRTETDKIRRLNDRVFWFPPGIEVKKDEFVRVFTVKKGVYKKNIEKYGNRDAVFHNFFWRLKKPIWDMVNSDAVTVFKIQSWNTESKG